MNRMVERVKKVAGQSIIRHARKEINELVKHAEAIAIIQRDDVIKTGIQKMQAIQSAEYERLVALAKVNPNIRKEEIDYLEDSSMQLQAFMRQTQLKLDAIRIVIVQK